MKQSQMTRTILNVWLFRSDSNSDKRYENAAIQRWLDKLQLSGLDPARFG